MGLNFSHNNQWYHNPNTRARNDQCFTSISKDRSGKRAELVLWLF